MSNGSGILSINPKSTTVQLGMVLALIALLVTGAATAVRVAYSLGSDRTTVESRLSVNEDARREDRLRMDRLEAEHALLRSDMRQVRDEVRQVQTDTKTMRESLLRLEYHFGTRTRPSSSGES